MAKLVVELTSEEYALLLRLAQSQHVAISKALKQLVAQGLEKAKKTHVNKYESFSKAGEQPRFSQDLSSFDTLDGAQTEKG